MSSNFYRAKCAFRPSEGGLAVAPAIITRSTPSSPCASVRGRVIVDSASVQAAAVQSAPAKKLPSPARHLPLPSEKLEKASSEPSLKREPAEKRQSGSEEKRKSTPLDALLAFEEGDLIEPHEREEDSVEQNTEEVVEGVKKTPEGESKEGDPSYIRALKELRVRVGELHPDLLYPTMIPEPDYCENSSQQLENNRRNSAQQQVGGVHFGLNKGSNKNKGGSPGKLMDPDGLILPRKPQNPCLESQDHKNLHRELLFNQKTGRSVLNQKSELQKALDRQREQQARREQEQQRVINRTPFQKMIEERAKKLEETMEKEDDKASELTEPEFIKVHAKLRARMDSK